MKPVKKNLGHSLRQRLLGYAQATKQDYNQVLLRFANERLLYRLSQSRYAERFLLKGAMLFLVWNDSVPHRPTRDLDLLGSGAFDEAALKAVFMDLCQLPMEDGLEFDTNSIRVMAIREEEIYGGLRVELQAVLYGARLRVQVDVGFGDTVTPEPEMIDLPAILPDFPAPRLGSYPVYTVIAEKLEALVKLGYTTSRMKDLYDMDFLLERFRLDEELLRKAIHRTFERRGTLLGLETPDGLTQDFVDQKQVMWRHFLNRNGLQEKRLDLTVARLRERLLPLLASQS